MEQKERTRTLLVQTWVMLCLEGPPSRLTVRELCRRAGVSRGTFYLHFEHLDDLRLREEDRLSAQLIAYAEELCHRPVRGHDPVLALTEIFSPLVEALADQRDEALVLLFSFGDGRFRTRLSGFMRENLRRWLGAPLKANPEAELLLEYLVSANLGVLAQWLKGGASLPPERVAGFLATTHCAGVLNRLKVAVK